MSSSGAVVRIQPGDVDGRKALVAELDGRQVRAVHARALTASLIDALSIDEAVSRLVALTQAKKYFLQKSPGGELTIEERDDAPTQLKALIVYFERVVGKAPNSEDALPEAPPASPGQVVGELLSSPAAMEAMAALILPAMLESEGGRKVLMEQLSRGGG